MKKTRILIADDHEIVRRGLRPLIASQVNWEICGEARDGRETMVLAEELRPDILVLDIGMPALNGVEVTRAIKRTLPEIEVLAFTGTESETLVHQLFAAGARGCVLKSEAAEHLIPALQALCAHQPYLTSRATRIVFESYLKSEACTEQTQPGGLTPREVETVQLLAEGKTNKEIAAIFGISPKTVETHRAAVMRKLDLASFSELVRYAVRHHLVAG